MKKILCIWMMFISFTGLAQEWKVFSDSSFEILYPDTWELSETRGVAFLALSQQINEQDLFRENVNLLIQDLKGTGLDLKKYTEISHAQIDEMIPNSKLISSQFYDDYHEVVYQGDQNGQQLQFLQHYYVINEKAFVLTYTAQKTDFDRYLEVSRKIMDSFKLKPY